MTQASQPPRTEATAQAHLTLDNADPVQMGFWVSNRVYATTRFLVPLRDHIAARKAAGTLNPMSPVVRDFKAWVSRHAVYRMWVESMIDQSNAYTRALDEKTRHQVKDVDGAVVWIKDFDTFFDIINEAVTTSPSYNNTPQVGCPIYALLAIPMGTPAGVALFHDAAFNAELKKVLDSWNAFLKSPASLDKLDIADPEKPGSWISKAAIAAGVWTNMEHDPSKPAYGYDSWNAFFIRKYVPGARPFKGDAATQINVGCETTPWAYENNVALKTDFWIKDVNYSLLDLLGGREDLAKLFEGGQVYQGFLSATHYHRWQAPLDGTIERAWVEPGTYFALRPAAGQSVLTWEGEGTQPYLPHVAARAIFILKHETLGYVALICIGMGEVSTCVIEPQLLVDGPDARPVPIRRGEEIGHFEFGGSTHVMIFQKDRVTLADWAVNAVKHQNDPQPIAMGSVIATAIGS